MLQLKPIEKIIIKNLPEPGATLQSYTFFLRFKILPFQLAHAVQNLKKQGLIEITEDRLGITKSGFDWLIQNRHMLKQGKNPEWKRIPIEFLQTAGKMGAPYIPRRDKLHKSIKSET